MANWKSVKDELPVIPKDRHCVSVLVAIYDRQYAECCDDPMNAWEVDSVLYGCIHDLKMFDGSEKRADFMTQWDNGKEQIWGPMGDPVYFWQYMPEAPNMIPE